LNLLSNFFALICSLFTAPTGFGTAGIRRHRIGGAIIIAGGTPWSLAQRGVETDEVGINIAAFSCRYYLAVNEKLPSNVGEPRARALADDWSRDITMRGETLVGGGGVLDFTIGTDCASGINNDVDTFKGGTPTPGAHGAILLDEATESQERAGWRTLDMRLSSDPQLILP
jgi:hypothetical protein